MNPLYKHQIEARDKLLAAGGSGCLFHDPGLGKTRTVLEIFAELKKRNKKLRLFVACPLSLVHTAWGEDVRKFTDFTYEYFKDNPLTDADIVSLNYESVISSTWGVNLFNIIKQGDWMCVLDESSRLKNPKSVTAKTLLEVRHFFLHRIVSSGTPMPNSEMELWAQVEFAKPEALHKSFYAFRNIYFQMARGNQVASSEIISREQMRRMRMSGWDYAIRPGMREHLLKKIDSFTHWMKKEDALDLPEKIEQVREVELTALEKRHYKEMKTELITEIGGKAIVAQVALTKLMKLRQITSGFVYDASGGSVTIPGNSSSKMKELLAILADLGKRQVIIWVQFREEVAAIKQRLEEAGYSHKSFSDTDMDVADKIREFKENKFQCLIAHPANMAHGLTLVNCSVMIYYSFDYSWERQIQGKDRIHRIGQTEKCFYIYLIARGTIDEMIYSVLNKKATLQEAVYELTQGKL